MTKVRWREALQWTEEQLDDLRFAGFAYIRQGKYEIALPFFEALVVIANDNAYDLQTLGALHLQMGSPHKALKFFDKALQLETDHSPTLLNLAKAFFILGKKNEGLKLANILKNEKDIRIANTAKALLLAYT